MALTLQFIVCAIPPLHAQGQDWPVWGGDPEGTKYSPLAQINTSNVGSLAEIWTWEPGEKEIPGPRQPIPGQAVVPGSFEVTPVVVNDTMYVVTPYNRVVALDAATGAELWSYDPRTYEWGKPPNGTGLVHRGIALWSGDGERRIFLNTRWRLIALNAANGQPIRNFGHNGEIDLTEHLVWKTNRLHYTQTSPPVVYRDLVILGNGVGDRLIYRQDTPGNIQAFDVHTGDLVWNFNPIPQRGEFGNETWEDGAWRYTGHTNVWAPFTLDVEHGLLYLPVGTPSNDWYGGHRKGDNLFAETLLCLNAATGERVWHFQTVHHGIWDYDLASPPTLLSINVDGRRVEAVAAPSKMGFVYVFDRLDGSPVWPIEERPVPPSDVPGERASPTQPFPTRPVAIARQGFTEAELIDFTPALRAEALEAVKQYRFGAMFEPPSLQGTIVMPGILGGANWGGAAADPETGVLYVKASNSPSLLQIIEADPTSVEADYAADLSVLSLRLPNGLPINKPPYGTLTAIDLNTGNQLWQVPAGDMPNVRFHPALRGVDLPERLGAVGATGPIVTAGGLVFLTGGALSIYAYDTTDGQELWSAPLGGRSNANPMTFATRAGQQLVMIASGAGEHTKLTAFGLPQP